MSIRMPYSLMTQLNDYAQYSGLSKTEIVVRAIASYLKSQQDNSLERRIAVVEKRITDLETKMKIAEIN